MSSVAQVTPAIARRLAALLDAAAMLEDTCAALVAQPAQMPHADRVTMSTSIARWQRDAAAVVVLIGRRGIVEYRGRAVPLAMVELTVAMLADALAGSRPRAQVG